jgi:hypothetical protein
VGVLFFYTESAGFEHYMFGTRRRYFVSLWSQNIWQRLQIPPHSKTTSVEI